MALVCVRSLHRNGSHWGSTEEGHLLHPPCSALSLRWIGHAGNTWQIVVTGQMVLLQYLKKGDKLGERTYKNIKILNTVFSTAWCFVKEIKIIIALFRQEFLSFKNKATEHTFRLKPSFTCLFVFLFICLSFYLGIIDESHATIRNNGKRSCISFPQCPTMGSSCVTIVRPHNQETGMSNNPPISFRLQQCNMQLCVCVCV